MCMVIKLHDFYVFKTPQSHYFQGLSGIFFSFFVRGFSQYNIYIVINCVQKSYKKVSKTLDFTDKNGC